MKKIITDNIEVENSLKLIETTFDDMVFKLDGSKLYSTVGKVDYNWEEDAVIFEPSGNIANVNDRVNCGGQLSHRIKPLTKIYPHLHWWQDSNKLIIFTLQYRINYNGTAKTTVWTTVTAQSMTNDNTFTYTSGTLNQITYFGSGLGRENSGIQLLAGELSAIAQFRFTRTDAQTGNILGSSFDFHFEVDTMGSATQGSKY